VGIATLFALTLVVFEAPAPASASQLVGGDAAFTRAVVTTDEQAAPTAAASADDRSPTTRPVSQPSDRPAARPTKPNAKPANRPTNNVRADANNRQDDRRRPDRAKPSTSSSKPGRGEARRIVAIARSHLGAKFRLGTEGNRYFDCSGLIYRVYQQAGLLRKIGGSRLLSAGYYYWFKNRGQASRHNPRAGDLVIWTQHGRITHSGIYIGGGRVISALVNPYGVMKTSVRGVKSKFLAYLHVGLDR
jgi:cell wall-associated NlpC family hydrolase